MENKTAEEFIREKIREKNSFPEKYVMDGLQRYYVTGEDCLRWSHEYAKQQQEIAVEKALQMASSEVEFIVCATTYERIGKDLILSLKPEILKELEK